MRAAWMPLLYFALFMSVAVGWRVYRVWRLSGVNALTTYRADGVYGLVSTLFRLVFAGIGVVTFVNLLPGLVAYLTPIPWLDLPVLQLIGWLILTVSFFIVVVAQMQMGGAWRIGVDSNQRQQLITHGIFRYSRNPIFLCMRLCFFGLLLVLPNAFTLMLWALGDAMTQIQVRLEETHLHEAFGEAYRVYAQSVRRWI